MYGIYARQSVERQDSISIEMQTDMCRERVPVGEGYDVYSDRGCTGTNTRRPEYQRMLSDVKSGRLSGIVVYKLDRISRSLLDFARLSEELERHSVKLISCTEELDSGSAMGQMIIRLLIMFAEMEQKMISQRVRDNYRARAAKGMPLGGVPPYGYDKNWDLNTQQAAVVRRIYSMLITGRSLDSIARSLNAENIASPDKSIWTGQQVSRQLKNAAYTKADSRVLSWLQDQGYQLLCKEEDYRTCVTVKKGDSMYIAPASHESIIESETWITAQELLLRRKPSNNGGSGAASFLQGIVICGKCGSSCYVRSNGKGYPYVYFVCRGKRLGICRGLKALRTEQAERFAGAILQQEFFRLMRSKPQPDRELMRLSGKPEVSEPAIEKRWHKLEFQQKKAAASLLIKNIAVTEEETVIFLR